MWTPPRTKDGTEFRWIYVIFGAFGGFALGAFADLALSWGGWVLITTITIIGAIAGFNSLEARGYTRDLSAPDEVARIRKNSEIAGRIMIVGFGMVLVAKIAKFIFS